MLNQSSKREKTRPDEIKTWLLTENNRGESDQTRGGFLRPWNTNQYYCNNKILIIEILMNMILEMIKLLKKS
jgi:hypothetical protein